MLESQLVTREGDTLEAIPFAGDSKLAVDTSITKQRDGLNRVFVPFLGSDPAHAEDPQRPLLCADTHLRAGLRRAEELRVDSWRDERVHLLGWTSAAPGPTPQILPEHMNRICSGPNVAVIALVGERDVIQVVAAKADDDGTAQQVAQVHPIDRQRPELEVQNFGRRRDNGRIEVEAPKHVGTKSRHGPSQISPGSTGILKRARRKRGRRKQQGDQMRASRPAVMNVTGFLVVDLDQHAPCLRGRVNADHLDWPASPA